MIIRRYFSLQILGATVAITLILTVILMSGRVIKYFGQAADGRLDVSLLMAVLVYRLPGFLDLIIPLGFYIAILLTLGRLYLDNEMAVLSASGVSRAQVVGYLLLPATVVMALVAGSSLWLTPTGNAASERLFAEAADRNGFDLIRPGRFQIIGSRTLYTDAMSEDKQTLLGVYVFEQKAQADKLPKQIVVHAARGRSEQNKETGERFLILENGVRYEVQPGEAAMREMRFDRYQVAMPTSTAVEKLGNMATHTTRQLFSESRSDRKALGEWLWRLSLPLFVPTAMLLAFALSRVNPRQGRFLKLLPAILLYLGYVVSVGAVRNAIEKGKAGESMLWSVHLAWFLLALLLVGMENVRLYFKRLSTRKAAA